MIDKFGREIVAYANYLVLKFIKYIWLKKHFFLLSKSRPGMHLWHKYPALLEIPAIQLLDLTAVTYISCGKLIMLEMLVHLIFKKNKFSRSHLQLPNCTFQTKPVLLESPLIVSKRGGYV